MKINGGLGFTVEAERELSKRKSRALRTEAERKELIRSSFPSVQAVVDSINEITVDIADKITASPKDADALQKLGNELIAAKNAELASALVKCGLPGDFLEKQYCCNTCRDTGIADGEICSCIKRTMIESVIKDSGINKSESFASFRSDLFDDPRDRRMLESVRAYCDEYVKAFPDNPLSDILFLGEPGVGKTFLLNCIGSGVLEKGYSVLKISAFKLIGSIMESFRGGEEKLPDLLLPDLLIIDDLGTEPMIANVTIETLLSIICERQDRDLATLLATNKDIDSLQDEYGQRIFSRLISPRRVKAIEIRTPSIRVKRFKD